MKLDPRRLLILLAVARAGGVLAAADELRVSPSAVSQQLSKLEREAGHALVKRTPRGTVLTAAGRAVVQAAEDIEQALNRARSQIQEGSAEPVGIVRIGGFTSFLRAVLIPQLPRWSAEYPHLQIYIVEDDVPSLMRLLRRGDLDAIIVELDAEEEEPIDPAAGMSDTLLFDEPWKLVIPSAAFGSTGVVDLSLLPWPLLGIKSPSASAAALSRMRRASDNEDPSVHQYQETLTALALVAAGQGAAVIPILALHGVDQAGVEVLDVPNLGTRRIVLRLFDRGRVANTPLAIVTSLIREAAATFDLRGPDLAL